MNKVALALVLALMLACGNSALAECSHEVTTDYCASEVWYEPGDNGYCLRKFKAITECDRCHTRWDAGIQVIEWNHEFQNDECIRCGVNIGEVTEPVAKAPVVTDMILLNSQPDVSETEAVSEPKTAKNLPSKIGAVILTVLASIVAILVALAAIIVFAAFIKASVRTVKKIKKEMKKEAVSHKPVAKVKPETYVGKHVAKDVAQRAEKPKKVKKIVYSDDL